VYTHTCAGDVITRTYAHAYTITKTTTKQNDVLSVKKKTHTQKNK